MFWTIDLALRAVVDGLADRRLARWRRRSTRRRHSATPTISAAAVAAVRPGWRIAFSRASRPVMPNSALERPADEPRPAGATSRGLSSATPRNAARGAAADEAQRRRRTSGRRTGPTHEQRHGAQAQQQRQRRRRTARRARAAARRPRAARRPAARAWRGSPGMHARQQRDQRADQQRDDDRARSAITVPLEGSVDADGLEQRLEAAARAGCRARGRPAAPRTPSTSPSVSTERRIWRRLAPSVRSSANSRVRCATVIENVLKMMNAPTNSEMPANASSAVRRKPRLSRMSLDWLGRLLVAGAHRARARAAPLAARR